MEIAMLFTLPLIAAAVIILPLIVNIARGAIIDTNALLEALHTNIGGAVLDVFDYEPLPENSMLWDKENVVISPHNSFVSDGNHRRMLDVIMNNLEGIN